MDTSLAFDQMYNLDLMAVMHQKNDFLHLIEELRHSRSTNKDLEAKIKSLHSNKIKLDCEINSLLCKNQKLTECCQELQDKLSNCCNASSENDYDSENKKLAMALEASETTISELKKSVLAYKAIINDLEKKLSEYEQKYLVAQQSSSLFCEKVEHFHKVVEKINRRLEKATNSQMHLERNVETVTALNAEYSYMQQNLEQIITNYEKNTQELKLQILNLKSKLKLKSLESDITVKESLHNEKILRLLNDNKMLQDLNSSLSVELHENKRQLQEANASLKRLHSVLKENVVLPEQAQLSTQLNTVKTEKVD